MHSNDIKNTNSPKTNSTAENFLIHGSILAIAGIIVRFIGLLYKIPLTRILGDEGMGYFNTAHEVYNIGLILSSYSLPLAISKLIAAKRIRGQFQDSRRVFLCGIWFGIISGGIMTLLLVLGADFITANIFHMPGSALPLQVMAPTIFVFSIMGVIRGYFQGYGNMIPTSLSQILEQIVNAVVSIAASYAFLVLFASQANPASFGAAGGTLGTLAGALAALALLTILMFRQRKTQTTLMGQAQSIPVESWNSIIKILLLTLSPIILSQFVYQLSGSVDNSMFGIIMEGKGLMEKERASLLGVYGGKYRLLSNVPVAIASALGTSMIPSIITSRIQHRPEDVKAKVRLTIKFNMLIAIPCAVGMGTFAAPIMQLIFGDSKVLSAQLMMLGAPAVIFFSLSTVTNAVLQGIELMRKSVTHSAISLVIHIALVYIMLNYLNWSVYGLVIGNVTFALVVCILNWIAIGKTLHYKQECKTTFILPLVAATVMGALSYVVYYGIHLISKSNAFSMLCGVAVAIAVYIVLIVLLKAVDEQELCNMPMGKRIVRICKKIKIM